MNIRPQVLIVEDLIDIPQIYVDLLLLISPMDFYFAQTAKEAILKIQELGSALSLILCDYSMPGASGVAVLRFNLENYRRPFCLITGGSLDSMEGLEDVHFDGKTNHFISKPLDEVQFISKMRILIQAEEAANSNQ